MIHIIITAYGEPKSTENAVNAFLNQDIRENYEIIVCDPFDDVEKYINERFNGNKKVRYYKDPDEGKSYALNLILNQIYSENKEDIIIFTDGDVYVGENSVNEILNAFKDKEIGAVCGRIVSLNSRDNIFGYWSHLLLDGANKTRKHLTTNRKFTECHGYLFAIRNGILKEFPEGASEDAVIPTLLWKKNYKIGYVENAEVYVLNPSNSKEWLSQKKRNIKGHEALKRIFSNKDAPPRTKSFFNEIKFGLGHALTYPRSLKEIFWTFCLFYYRLKVWKMAYGELRNNKPYKDGWREDENLTSTRLEEQ